VDSCEDWPPRDERPVAWAGCLGRPLLGLGGSSSLAQKRHRQGYNALYLDWHVGYLKVQPEDPEFQHQEIRLWEVTQ
jgi:prepilin-type processing-associated H-X9-DG protein